MKFIINGDKLKIEQAETINSGSFEDYLIPVEFDETWNDLTIEAIIVEGSSSQGISRAVINNEVYIDVSKKKRYTIGFIGYTVENNQKVHQKTTDLKIIPMLKGAGEIEATNTEEIPTESEWEIYLAQVQEFINNGNTIITQANNLDIDVNKEDRIATVTITKKDGTEKSVQINDGEKGDKGDDYVITQEDYQEIADIVENQINIPAKTSDLTNDSGFITKLVNDLSNYYLKSETYTKTEVNNLIGQIGSLQFQVVNELPVTGNSSYIYLVPSSNPTTQNIKDEYIWVNNAWEQIGSTQIDLTSYATENWVNSQISNFLTSTQIQNLINASLDGYVQDSNYVHTDNNYTSAEKTKLENLEEENEALYNDHPDITATGTNVTLNGTGDFKMKVDVGGNSTQETTSTSEGDEYDSPSPEHKQDINNVEGDVVVISKNSNNTKSNTVTFPLSQGQKLMLGDTLKDDGVYHKRTKVTANELKTVTTYVNQLTDFVRISFMISDLTNKVANEIPSGLCNYLKFLYDYTNESNHFYARGNIIYVFLEKTLLSSLNVTGVRAFLDEHPDLEIEYDLAKETPEDYTTTQQTAYNKLKEMQSYYDLTYVTGSSDNAQPILTVRAKKSLKVMQNEINNIESRLSLLE